MKQKPLRLPDEVDQLIRQNIPTGVSQNEFLTSLIVDGIKRGPQPELFTQAVPPKMVAGLPFTFIDLFAGIGGFRCGMQSLGGKCAFTNEWNKWSVKTYRAWYGDSEDHINDEDIRDPQVQESIPDHDILCAGFPCQPFSIAGVSKKNALGRAHGFDDELQGNLFASGILPIVDSKRPPVLFLENVMNLKHHDKGRTWKIIRSSLEERNYQVFAKVISASGWVPQNRRRVLIVCFNKDIFGEGVVDFRFPNPPNTDTQRVGDILVENPDKKYMLTEGLWKYLDEYKNRKRSQGTGFGYGKVDADSKYTRTMSARYWKDGSEILIDQPGWERPRRLTPREACLLMGFSDDYAELFGHREGFPQVVSDRQAYEQFGNAVVPKVVQAVGQQIVGIISDRLISQPNGCLIRKPTQAFSDKAQAA